MVRCLALETHLQRRGIGIEGAVGRRIHGLTARAAEGGQAGEQVEACQGMVASPRQQRLATSDLSAKLRPQRLQSTLDMKRSQCNQSHSTSTAFFKVCCTGISIQQTLWPKRI